MVVLPVIVAAVLTFLAVRLFHEDKELYVYDLSAQSVELVARNLATRLESLQLKATRDADGKASPPFLDIRRGEGPLHDPTFLVEKMASDRLRVRVRTRGSKEDGLVMTIPAQALLDLRGYTGPTELMVVNRAGEVLVHPEPARAPPDVQGLLRQLGPFRQAGARAGTRLVSFRERPTLAAYATVGRQLAVLQTMDQAEVGAAARPLVTSAVVAALLVVLVAVFLALLLGRSILRPLQLMARQAEAIGRGEFGVAVNAGGAAELGQLMDSLNTMSAALKKREEELQQMQRQLLQAERINASGRMIAAIVKELSEPLERCFDLAGKTRQRLPESSSLREVQKQIMDESNRASNILQNLARLSSREDSSVDAAAQQSEPDIILSDVLVSSRPLFEKHQLRVATDLDTGVSRVPMGAEQLRNALLDVFLFVSSNATREGQIHVSLAARDGAPVLGVTYSGTPLSTEQRGDLLRPSTAAKAGALELAIAASVFEEHGGRLTLEPTDDGNRIVVTLPAGPAQ